MFLNLAEMLVQFTPQRALFSAIFFVNCITFLLLFKQLTTSHSNIFGSSKNLSSISTILSNISNNPSDVVTTLPNVIPTQSYLDQKIDLECSVVDDLNKEGIVIVLKTGAQEISKLAIHFSTTLRCFEPEEDILIFSDLEQTVGNFKIHDALRNVDEEMRNNHPDFEIYRIIQHYNATGQDLSNLSENQKFGDNRAGWKLDKYKFLHMVEETYAMRPNANWYAFVETDTYMFWPNLVKWLERWESSEPYYMGSPTRIGNQPFAHGGSGYVISKTAMSKLLAGNKDHQLSKIWDEKLQSKCCGDFGLGKALSETGTQLTGSWPMCQGESPITIPFGKEYWCQPVVTMHHATPDDISRIWRFQRQREDEKHNQSPILYRDIHNSFLLPQFPHTLDNWDNISTGLRYAPPEFEEHLDSDSDSETTTPADFNSKSKVSPSLDHDPSLSPLHGDITGTYAESEVPPLDHDPTLSALHGDIDPEFETNSNADNRLPEMTSKPKSKDPPKMQSTKHLKSKRSESQTALKIAQENSYKSFEHCAKACQADGNCFQYSFHDLPGKTGKEAGMGDCVLGRMESWTWGRYREGVRSGWVLYRIRDWVWKEENDCKVIGWVD